MRFIVELWANGYWTVIDTKDGETWSYFLEADARIIAARLNFGLDPNQPITSK